MSLEGHGRILYLAPMKISVRYECGKIIIQKISHHQNEDLTRQNPVIPVLGNLLLKKENPRDRLFKNQHVERGIKLRPISIFVNRSKYSKTPGFEHRLFRPLESSRQFNRPTNDNRG